MQENSWRSGLRPQIQLGELTALP